jgi:hypothetical protein
MLALRLLAKRHDVFACGRFEPPAVVMRHDRDMIRLVKGRRRAGYLLG